MHKDSVLLRFFDGVAADLDESGALPALETYLRRFPDDEELIRSEYESLCESVAEPNKSSAPQFVGGRYRLLESLGRGGFGEVFLAEDARIRRHVAVKLLPGVRAIGSEWRKRLAREAEAANRIGHAGLCAVEDVGDEQGIPYLVMPWISGQSLDRVFALSSSQGLAPVRLRQEERVEERRAAVVRLVEHLARTLAAAHAAGVVHRDVKPANILLRSDGTPVLIDFGLAWLETDETSATRTAALGTTSYAAPELVTGRSTAPDPRLDVWSLGVVLFEGLTARRPFEARPGTSFERTLLEQPVPRLTRDCGEDLQAIVETALSRDPERRYPNMESFAADLERWRRGEPVGVRAAGLLRRLAWWVRAHPVAIAIGLAATALALSLTVVGANAWARSRERAMLLQLCEHSVGPVGFLAENAGKLAALGVSLSAFEQDADQTLTLAKNMRQVLGAEPELDRALARFHLALGQLQLQMAKTEAGSWHVREALRLRKSLIEQGDLRVEDSDAIALALILIGDSHAHVGELDKALLHFEEALKLHHALLQGEPQNATRHSDVGFGFLRNGQMLRRQGRLSDSARSMREALRFLTDAAELDPKNVDRSLHIAEAECELSELLFQARAPARECAQYLQDVEARLQERLQRLPDDAKAWNLLLRAKTGVLGLARSEDDPEALMDESVIIAQRLVRLDDSQVHAHHALGACHKRRAQYFVDRQRWVEAARDIEEALRETTITIAAQPKFYLFVGERVGTLIVAAQIREQTTGKDVALRLLKEAEALIEERLREPGTGTYGLELYGRVCMALQPYESEAPRRFLQRLEEARSSGEYVSAYTETIETIARSFGD